MECHIDISHISIIPPPPTLLTANSKIAISWSDLRTPSKASVGGVRTWVGLRPRPRAANSSWAIVSTLFILGKFKFKFYSSLFALCLILFYINKYNHEVSRYWISKYYVEWKIGNAVSGWSLPHYHDYIMDSNWIPNHVMHPYLGFDRVMFNLDKVSLSVSKDGLDGET